MKGSILGALLAVAVLAAASGCGAEPAEGPAQIVYSVGGAHGSRHAGLFVTDDEGRDLRRLTRAPGPAAIDAEWSPAGDLILFEVQTELGGEIWTMNPDGSGARNIADGLSASWSPDGREVAVVGSKGFISILSADGSALTEIDLGLGEDESVEIAPDWSPNGAELVLSVSPPNISASRIVAVRVDGKGRPRSLGEAREGVLEERSRWSPDGSLIAFQRSDETEGTSVWVMRPDGSGRRLVARDVGPPVWSLDGKSLLCEVTAPGRTGVFAYPLDGGDPQHVGPIQSGLHESRGRFRHEVGTPVSVSWHPGGTRVVYVDDAGRVIVSRPDGSEKRQLTDPGEDAMPDWSPDGSQIAFVRGSDGDSEVYVIGSDGKGERRIAPGSGPQWSSDGTALLIGVTRGKEAGFAVVTLKPLQVGRMVRGGSAVWSPDGEAIAFLTHRTDPRAESSVPYQSTLYVMRPDLKNVRRLAESGPGQTPLVFNVPAWSPDGESLLVAEEDPMSSASGRLLRVDLAGSGQETIARHEFSAFEQVTVSPDGKRAAYLIEGAAQIETIDLDDGDRKTVARLDEGFFSGPAWSPDGKKLAYVASPSEGVFNLYRIDADGTDRRRISKPPAPVGDFDWRPS
jgi:Tol biopolymer transport system component